MISDIQMLSKHLREHGFSTTNARQQVFLTLLNNEPLTVSQAIVKTKNIDRASVYRTINLFESIGIIDRLSIGWKYKIELSDKFNHHHHHIICNKCSEIAELPDNHELEELIVRLSKAANYVPIKHQIEVMGICDNCQN